MARILEIAKYCVNDSCNQKLRKYAYWVGKEFKAEKDGPFCKSCAKFISHLRGDDIVYYQIEVNSDEMTEGSG